LPHASCDAGVWQALGKGGLFDQVDDIFHIRERDFERVIHAPELYDLRPEVAKHRAELEEFKRKQTQPVVTYEGIRRPWVRLQGLERFTSPSLWLYAGAGGWS